MDSTKLELVVVEYHHHALEHIHRVLRRRIAKSMLGIPKEKKRNNRSSSTWTWTLVNFDSHPDMACMNFIPALASFTPRTKTWNWDGMSRPTSCSSSNSNSSTMRETEPKNLYELLDTSDSGIAEWILPLVLAAGLQTVYWIRSAWANQFLSDGIYNFAVGVSCSDSSNMDKLSMITSFLDLPEDALIKVSLMHPYYYDDHSVVPSNQLLCPQNVRFIVTEQLSNVAFPVLAGASLCYDQDDTHHWCLSIDMDYFYCLNPFLADLERLDLTLCQAILLAAKKTQFRSLFQSTLPWNQTSFQQRYEHDLRAFTTLTTTYFQNYRDFTSTENCNTHTDNSNLDSKDQPDSNFYDRMIQQWLEEDQQKCLYQLYETPEIGKILWSHITHLLVTSPMFHSLPLRTHLANQVLQALPYLFLPHPSYESSFCSMEMMVERVQLMCEQIHKTPLFQKHPPFLIVLARSTLDGFTPSYIVEDLQRILVRELHQMYCGCSHVYQYQEDELPKESPTWQTCHECRVTVLFDY